MNVNIIVHLQSQESYGDIIIPMKSSPMFKNYYTDTGEIEMTLNHPYFNIDNLITRDDYLNFYYFAEFIDSDEYIFISIKKIINYCVSDESFIYDIYINHNKLFNLILMNINIPLYENNKLIMIMLRYNIKIPYIFINSLHINDINDISNEQLLNIIDDQYTTQDKKIQFIAKFASIEFFSMNNLVRYIMTNNNTLHYNVIKYMINTELFYYIINNNIISIPIHILCSIIADCGYDIFICRILPILNFSSNKQKKMLNVHMLTFDKLSISNNVTLFCQKPLKKSNLDKYNHTLILEFTHYVKISLLYQQIDNYNGHTNNNFINRIYDVTPILSQLMLHNNISIITECNLLFELLSLNINPSYITNIINFNNFTSDTLKSKQYIINLYMNSPSFTGNKHTLGTIFSGIFN